MWRACVMTIVSEAFSLHEKGGLITPDILLRNANTIVGEQNDWI